MNTGINTHCINESTQDYIRVKTLLIHMRLTYVMTASKSLNKQPK